MYFTCSLIMSTYTDMDRHGQTSTGWDCVSLSYLETKTHMDINKHRHTQTQTNAGTGRYGATHADMDRQTRTDMDKHGQTCTDKHGKTCVSCSWIVFVFCALSEHVFTNVHKRSVNKVVFHVHESDMLLSGSQDGYMKLFVSDHRPLSALCKWPPSTLSSL